jgi:hypothetical protein
MGRQIILLGTDHALQEAEKRGGNIVDPDFRELVEQLANEFSVDFIFEEASNLGPTFAEKFATKKLGPDRYRDVDPSRESRQELNLLPDAEEAYWIGRPNLDTCHWGSARQQLLDVHEGREQLWLQAIKARDFSKALMIIGQAHLLSFGFQLKSEELEVRGYCYMPYALLARGA